MDQHFFIIGAQRSGTTYLYELLEQHREICMARPVRPEPKFFLDNALDSATQPQYTKLFDHRQSHNTLLGEKATSYIESSTAARRIHDAFPNAKIVAVLRDPVERAISNYRFSCENGLETLSIEEAILQEDKRTKLYDRDALSTSPFAYLARGKYCDYLKVYRDLFSQQQMFLLTTESLLKNAQTLDSLCDFLGVERYQPQRDFKSNSSTLRSPPVSESLRRYMREYFIDSNLDLVQNFQVDTDHWTD